MVKQSHDFYNQECYYKSIYHEILLVNKNLL